MARGRGAAGLWRSNDDERDRRAQSAREKPVAAAAGNAVVAAWRLYGREKCGVLAYVDYIYETFTKIQ